MTDISRRSFVKIGLATGFLAASGASLTSLAGCAGSASSDTFLMVGAWGHDGFVPYNGKTESPDFTSAADGIKTYSYNNGNIKILQDDVSDKVRVGATIIDEDLNLIHVADEVTENVDFFPEAMGSGGGNIYTYEIGPDGKLTEVEIALAFGANPSYLYLSGDKKFFLSSNYGGGGIDGGGPCTTAEFDENGHLYPKIHYTEQTCVCRVIEADGTLGPITDVFKVNEGKSGARMHAIKVDPIDGKLIVACEKGLHKLYFMNIDENGKFVNVKEFDENKETGVENLGGRYIVFHPTKKWFYVNGESSPKMMWFSYENGDPELKGVYDVIGEGSEEIVAKAKEIGGRFEQQDFQITPDGRFMYDLMRGANGYDSIIERCAVFEINQETGEPTLIQGFDLPEGALWPRGADIAPDGKFMAVACVFSHEVLMLKIADDGTLSLHERTEFDTAAHVRFYKAATA